MGVDFHPGRTSADVSGRLTRGLQNRGELGIPGPEEARARVLESVSGRRRFELAVQQRPR
jgi:hypothetical protein